MAAIKDLNDVSSAILDMDTLAMDSMDMRPEAFGAPGAQSKETMSSDSRAGEREQQDWDGVCEIDGTDAQEMEFRGAKETNHDLMTDPGTPGTLQEVFSEDGHETKGMSEKETGYDDEGLMTDPGTPDTPQEEFLQDAQELDEIKDINVDETEEEGVSDDEVLDLNSGSPQDESNPPGEIKDMNVDGPENDLVVLGDGAGGEKSVDGERFVAPFPINRVKRIIKLDKDVRLVAGDAIALIAQATALFVQNLSSASFTVMLRTKRKTIRGPDVVLAAKSTRQFRECLGNDLATLLEESSGDTANGEDGPVEKEHGTSDEPVRTRPPQQKSAKKHQLAAPPGSRPITNFFKAEKVFQVEK